MLGVGTDFVEGRARRPDRRVASPDQTRFSAALDARRHEPRGLFWVDVTGLRGIVETQLPPRSHGRLRDATVKPYLEAVRQRHRDDRRPGDDRRQRNGHHHASAQTDATPPEPNSAGPAHRARPHGGAPHPMAVRIRLTRVGATKQPTLPAGRRRQPLRPRRARDRHDRALQPPHRPDRARRRRGQGQGLAVEGRPAVRHRPPPVQAGRRARRPAK